MENDKKIIKLLEDKVKILEEIIESKDRALKIQDSTITSLTTKPKDNNDK